MAYFISNGSGLDKGLINRKKPTLEKRIRENQKIFYKYSTRGKQNTPSPNMSEIKVD